MAASTDSPPAQNSMLDTARDVMDGSALLIQEAKQTLSSPGDAESQQRLAQVGTGAKPTDPLCPSPRHLHSRSPGSQSPTELNPALTSER